MRQMRKKENRLWQENNKPNKPKRFKPLKYKRMKYKKFKRVNKKTMTFDLNLNL